MIKQTLQKLTWGCQQAGNNFHLLPKREQLSCVYFPGSDQMY